MRLLKKLLYKFKDLLPGKRLFFIYTHHNIFDRFRHGLKANSEISYFCHKALQKEFPRVTFLRLEGEKESRINWITEKDLVIGHIGETYRKACKRTKNIIAFYPWSGNEDRNNSQLFNCIPKTVELKDLNAARSIILLTSEYNQDRYLKNNYNFWHNYFKTKRYRCVHQPIDLELFKRVKFDYTTDNFLYIGNNAHMKCLSDTKKLVRNTKRTLHIYGGKKQKLDNLDSDAVNALCSKADFFIQPGRWEAQCVSILEAAARGFIPLVSKETGYPYDHPFLLRYNDQEYNLQTIRAALALPEKERKALADDLHKQLTDDPNHNSWSQLTDVLVSETQHLLQTNHTKESPRSGDFIA